MNKVYELVARSGQIDPDDIGYKGFSPDANSILESVLNTVYMVAGVAAVIVIIVAGAIYITSNDDSGKITRAKNAILGAVAGLIIIIMAFAITQLIIGRF